MFDRKKMEELRQQLRDWELENRARLQATRKPADAFTTRSGTPIKPVYTPLDLEEKGFDYAKDLGMPGSYPFTRGISPGMYREQLWHMSQYAGHPTPEDSNKLWKTIIGAGGNQIFIAFDLPSQLGYDPDYPEASGEVGRVGVSLSSLRDWEVAFDGIDLEKITISVNLNAPGMIGIATHLALLKSRGVDVQHMHGTCQNDILKEYTARGNYIFGPKHGARLVADCLSYCATHAPGYRPIQVCSAQYADSGATPVNDSVLALVDALAYFDEAVARGIDIDLIAPGVIFLINIDYYDTFFERLARLRAMRKLYARYLKERYGAKKPESMMGRWYGNEGGPPFTRQQPLNNIARSTLACLCGVLGGCQHIDLRSYDEQYGIPTPEAIVYGPRIQNIVAYETGIPDTVDPLGGSYFVEWLTLEMEKKIRDGVEEILKLGGAIECIENGYIQKMLAKDGYQWIKDRQSGKTPWVGVNIFTTVEEERPVRIYRADPNVEKKRIEAVTENRKKRDNSKVKEALAHLKEAVQLPPTKENNLMEPVVEAVQSYATVGEICTTLRELWGEWREPSF
ncbi:MAG: methylmalonyl-CoA mutase [Chloroflexi bacterium]|nr:methylmalonyl-CoA mutase [Chloroflexota bacterium]